MRALSARLEPVSEHLRKFQSPTVATVAGKVHVALIIVCCIVMQWVDWRLAWRFIKGFPLVGPLPPVHLSREDRPPKPKGVPLSVTELRARRLELNQVVLTGVRELPFS